jgi:2-polyprenyl-3-methyl-5-hydroxy-6-metoxy-1,4-benzoquinol methylase
MYKYLLNDIEFNLRYGIEFDADLLDFYEILQNETYIKIKESGWDNQGNIEKWQKIAELRAEYIDKAYTLYNNREKLSRGRLSDLGYSFYTKGR